MKKKVAIITELTEGSTNYGNVLQAYALNKFLNQKQDFVADTLMVNSFVKKKITTISPKIIITKLRKKYCCKKELLAQTNALDERKKKFNDFCKDISIKRIASWNDMIAQKYTTFIVGSDIVWIQSIGMINRTKFLDFKASNKISYAASFGCDFIPKENVKFIKKYLLDFSNISLREASTIKLLDSIGIKNSKHVCDPTLLLTSSEWESIEKRVDIDGKYIFVYLLGKDLEQRKYIKIFANKYNYKIVSIPYADGKYNDVDANFADVNVNDCSPCMWIYLIHRCEIVFTDSFHATVFSTIFQKKFIIVQRENTLNINNRMMDYLKKIEQQDKFVNLDENFDLNKFNWDYENINLILKGFVTYSKHFLNESIK